MDLLFSKYASPYIFLCDVLEMQRLHDFVIETVEAENDKKMWEIYLSLVANPYSEVTSFEEFKRKNTPAKAAAIVNLEDTVKESHDVLQNFHPVCKAGGET